MASIFYDLLVFFGISADVPQNLGEFIPWFMSVLVALSLFLFVFDMIRKVVSTINRSARW